MSGYATPFMNGLVPLTNARELHLAFSYWSFIIMGVHIDMHFGIITAKLPKEKIRIIAGCVLSVIAAYGFRLFLDADAAKLNELFAPGEIDRIFINFCDPWPKSRDAKFRLTAPGFLRVYCDCLKTDGDILFKTDNLPLFDWSEEQFRKEGWEILSVTRDLHANGVHEIMTDYESKFNSEGIPIKKLRAGKTKQTLSTSAGPVARLRNASLSDARGMAE